MQRPATHVVRVGVLGQLGQFTAPDFRRYPRGTRVIVRTARGIETGEVLSNALESEHGPLDGELLRAMTVEDDLLAARLQKDRVSAWEACEARLADCGVSDVAILDIEPLFDGSTLLFYFLGQPGPEVEALLDELAETYNARARITQFAATLHEGCGPGCGTEQALGHGCTSCGSGCAVADACGTKRSRT